METKLFRDDEVPLSLRQPYILHHYRHKLSYQDCIKSLWYFHNESVNIWTDLLTSGVMGAWTVATMFRNDLSPIQKAVFGMSGIGCTLCKILSCSAHTFACKSEDAERFWFRLDYIGLCATAVGGAPSALYVGKKFPLTPFIYLTTMATLARFCMDALTRNSASSFAKFGFLGSLLIFMELPIFHRLVFEKIQSRGAGTFRLWLLFTGYLITAGLLYVSRIPERFWPGKFDLVGHSHNWWHILSNISIFFRHYFLIKLFLSQKRKKYAPFTFLDLGVFALITTILFLQSIIPEVKKQFHLENNK